MSDGSDLISAAAACDILGIDRATLTRWVKAQKLTPVTRLDGNAYVFSRSAVEALRQWRQAEADRKAEKTAAGAA